jgi:hypothetical protein
MCLTFQLVGQLVQITGVIIVWVSQLVFVWKAHKKYGSLGVAFLVISAPQISMEIDEIKETAKNKKSSGKLSKGFVLPCYYMKTFKLV